MAQAKGDFSRPEKIWNLDKELTGQLLKFSWGLYLNNKTSADLGERSIKKSWGKLPGQPLYDKGFFCYLVGFMSPPPPSSAIAHKGVGGGQYIKGDKDEIDEKSRKLQFREDDGVQ